MLKENFTLPAVHAFLKTAGLLSFLSHPVWICGPMVLQDYATGRIRIDQQQQQPPDVQGQSYAEYIRDRAEERNGLRMIAVAPGHSIAVQPVNGIIVGGANAEEEFYYSLFNLDRFHHASARIAGDQSIKTLILKMDTPGGSVFGLHAAAQALLTLQEARPDMTVVTYVQRLCCSAGMYLGAATQEIHASSGAAVGSIGTIAELSDWSGFKEKIGLETRRYTADSTLKDLGASPITAAHDAYMTDLVGKYSAEFKSWMSDRRGLSAADMHGQYWEARHAPAGMVDSAVFATFEEFLAAGLTV